MDSGLRTAFLIDVSGHCLADPVFRRCIELAVLRIQLYYKRNGCHSRWGLKFFNSECESKDVLDEKVIGGKLRTHDMCAPAADTVRQELETRAHFLMANKSRTAGDSMTSVTSDTRCENIRTALREVLGDGLHDGSFAESSVVGSVAGKGRKEMVSGDGVESVASKARNNHAIYLFCPSMGRGLLKGTQVGVSRDVSSMKSSLKEDALRLNGAFKKYNIILQWVDTLSAMTCLLRDQSEHGAKSICARQDQEAQQDPVPCFIRECMKDYRGSMIPFEAMLHPSQIMPFSLVLERCLADGLQSETSDAVAELDSIVRQDRNGRGASTSRSECRGAELSKHVVASLNLGLSDLQGQWTGGKDKVSLLLSPVNVQAIAALRPLLGGDIDGQGGGEGVEIVVEEWIQRADVSPSWFLSDAAWWCEAWEDEVLGIPETPSPVKADPAAQSANAEHDQCNCLEASSEPSLPTMLRDLCEHNALLLVSVRAKGKRWLTPSSASGHVSESVSKTKPRLALMSSLAANGRIGFLQLVSEAVLNRPSIEGTKDVAASAEDGNGAGHVGGLQPFSSYLLEEWTWKPCEELLQLSEELNQNGARAAEYAHAPVDIDGQEKTCERAGDKTARDKLIELLKQERAASARCVAGDGTIRDSGSTTNSIQATPAVISASKDSNRGAMVGSNNGQGEGGLSPATARKETTDNKIWGSTESEVLHQLDVRYELFVDTFKDRNPIEFFEQTIPEAIEVLQRLHSAPSKEGDVSTKNTCFTEKSEGNGEITDSKKVVLSHIKTKWIKKSKEWSKWLVAGVSKDVCKRRHEFQALFRLYLMGNSKSIADDAQGIFWRNLRSALSRFFVNSSRSEKLRYMKDVLQPLCSHLPRTLESIMDSFDLSLEDESPAKDTAPRPKSILTEDVGTPIPVKKSGEPMWSGGSFTGEASHEAYPRNNARTMSNDGPAIRAVSQSMLSRQKSSGGGKSRGGSSCGKLGKRQASRVGFGSKTIKEMTMPGKKKAHKGAASGNVHGKADVRAVSKRKDSKELLPAMGKEERIKDAALKNHQKSSRLDLFVQQHFESKSSGLGSSQLASMLSQGQQPDAGTQKGSSSNVRATDIAAVAKAEHRVAHAQDRQIPEQHLPMNSQHLLSTPARCKVATVLVPETPETKMTAKGADGADAGASVRRPPRMMQLPAVEKFIQPLAATAANGGPLQNARSSKVGLEVQRRTQKQDSFERRNSFSSDNPGHEMVCKGVAEMPGYPDSPEQFFELDSPPRLVGLFAVEGCEASNSNEPGKVEFEVAPAVNGTESAQDHRGETGRGDAQSRRVSREIEMGKDSLAVELGRESTVKGESGRQGGKRGSTRGMLSNERTLIANEAKICYKGQDRTAVLCESSDHSVAGPAEEAAREVKGEKGNDSRKGEGKNILGGGGLITTDGEAPHSSATSDEESKRKQDQEYYVYQSGDYVLVSTEHLERKVGKSKRAEKYSVQSLANVIGPFEVLEVLGEKKSKYKLKLPQPMGTRCSTHTNVNSAKLSTMEVHASALQLFKTKWEMLSASAAKRTERAAANAEGVFIVQWVLDIEEKEVNGKSQRSALVVWEGNYPEAEKYTWEPIKRAVKSVQGDFSMELTEKHDAMSDFYERQKAAAKGWAPSLSVGHMCPPKEEHSQGRLSSKAAAQTGGTVEEDTGGRARRSALVKRLASASCSVEPDGSGKRLKSSQQSDEAKLSDGTPPIAETTRARNAGASAAEKTTSTSRRSEKHKAEQAFDLRTRQDKAMTECNGRHGLRLPQTRLVNGSKGCSKHATHHGEVRQDEGLKLRARQGKAKKEEAHVGENASREGGGTKLAEVQVGERETRKRARDCGGESSSAHDDARASAAKRMHEDARTRSTGHKLSCAAKFQAGDLVLISTARLGLESVQRCLSKSKSEPSKRKNEVVSAWSTNFLGPFEIMCVEGRSDGEDSSEVFRLKLPRGKGVPIPGGGGMDGDVGLARDKFEASELCLFRSRAQQEHMMSGRILPRVTRRKEEEGEFVPELVLAMRAMDKTNGRQSRSLHALVAWLGYDVTTECTWEPIEDEANCCLTLPELCHHLEHGASGV